MSEPTVFTAAVAAISTLSVGSVVRHIHKHLPRWKGRRRIVYRVVVHPPVTLAKGLWLARIEGTDYMTTDKQLLEDLLDSRGMRCEPRYSPWPAKGGRRDR